MLLLDELLLDEEEEDDDEDEDEEDEDEEPVQVMQGGPLEVVVVQLDELVEDVEKDVAQGIYSTIVEVEQDGGGHVVSQSQTVTAVAGTQLHG